jgi:DNA-binding GntR family transcriptional regulator
MVAVDRRVASQDDLADSVGGEIVTARERAYHAIRERLITLDLAPGSVVDVARLSKECSLGTTPVREAIQRLANDELLTIHPRRGTVVSEPTLSQARHILEVRDAFEGRAARLSSQRATATDIAELQRLLALQAAERDEADYAQFMRHDVQFHMRIAHVSGNPMLVRALDHLLALNMRLWFVFFRIQGPQARFMLPHESLMKAVAARDLDAAEAAAVAHVRESNTLLLSMFHEVQISGIPVGLRDEPRSVAPHRVDANHGRNRGRRDGHAAQADASR